MKKGMINTMRPNVLSNVYRSIIVSIDSYENRVLKGRFTNASFEGALQFNSLMAFILLIEKLLNDLEFPQSYTVPRTFCETSQVIGNKDEAIHAGLLATLELKIFFRQNASWQGRVKWIDSGRDESFRSALELLLLINSALEPDR